MLKYLIFALVLAFASAKPTGLVAAPHVLSYPAYSHPLTYAAYNPPLTYAAGYASHASYASPYAYNYYKPLAYSSHYLY